MNCKYMSEKISDYIDGILPPDKADEMRNHLLTCSKCNNIYTDMVHLVDDLSSLKIPVDADESLHSFRESLKDIKNGGTNTYLTLIKITSVAATIILVISGIYVMTHYTNNYFDTHTAQTDTTLQQDIVAEQKETLFYTKNTQQQLDYQQFTPQEALPDTQNQQPTQVAEATQSAPKAATDSSSDNQFVSAGLIDIPVDLTVVVSRKKVKPDFASTETDKPAAYTTVHFDDGTSAKEYDPTGKGGAVYIHRDTMIHEMAEYTTKLISELNGKVIGTHIDPKDFSIPVQFMVVSIPQEQYDYFLEKIEAMFESERLEAFESLTGASRKIYASESEEKPMRQVKIIFNNIK